MASSSPLANILRHTGMFLSEMLLHSELRHRLFSLFHKSADQTLAVKTIENAASTSTSDSSLRLAEKILDSENTFSSFLLSLVYTLLHRPVDAALSLLHVFYTDPYIARVEIAPLVFEELFLIHLIPILHWYNHQRSTIMSFNSVAVSAATKSLSTMSTEQASQLKDLENQYEQILDENCRIYAAYFEEVLRAKNHDRLIDPPSVILQRSDYFEFSKDEEMINQEFGFENGRYNPMWADSVEGDKSFKLTRSSKMFSKFPSFCPERVSLKVLTSQRSSIKSTHLGNSNFCLEHESCSRDDSDDPYSTESKGENEDMNKRMSLTNTRQMQYLNEKQPILGESSCHLDPFMEFSGKNTPPKDFVCPITTHVLEDPVTLETGQTYERKAIQEWLERGNATCPITRQKLHSTQLPKTNYVLKRLIASWQKKNENSAPVQTQLNKCEPVMRPAPCSSIGGQGSLDGTISELRRAITNLCTSESLRESEMAVLQIEQFWRVETELLDSFIKVLISREEDLVSMFMKPKSASVLLLRHVLRNTEDERASKIVKRLTSAKVIEAILGSLEAELVEERLSAMFILLRFMQHDGRCRNMIADRAELTHLLESFIESNDADRFDIIQFLSELVKLNRRTFNEQVLHIIKNEGLDRTDSNVAQNDIGYLSSSQESTEEEQAAEDWERKMAFSLVSHEFGLLFEALADGLKSKSADLFSACFLSATWLVYMLIILPDTGIRGAARVCLLKQFVSIFKSSRDTENKALCLLALRTFIHEPEGLHDLTIHVKDILKGLRELKKSSTVAVEVFNLFSEEQESSADMWNHKEIALEDCSVNGEVSSIVCYRNKVFSSHTDGTIKVWTVKTKSFHLIQEIRDHLKAVTSLVVIQSGGKLYSGSLDRTVRVWSIQDEGIECEEIHEMKDHVNNLLVSNSLSCFIPQGAGIKVHSWNGSTKLLNQQKYAKCLTLAKGKLYCGCLDNSIQDIDLPTGTINSIQSGSRKLLGKSSPIYAIQVHDGLLFSAGTSLDGVAVKIRNTANYSMVGSLQSTLEVRTMAVSSELIYIGGKGGIVEAWCKKKHNRVEVLQTGINGKVVCMAFDTNEETLVIGTSDGRIQAWKLS